MTYRIVFSDPDGSRPISTAPTPREDALTLFGVLARATMFGPHGATIDGRHVHERMRVVDDQEWPNILATAARRSAS